MEEIEKRRERARYRSDFRPLPENLRGLRVSGATRYGRFYANYIDMTGSLEFLD